MGLHTRLTHSHVDMEGTFHATVWVGALVLGSQHRDQSKGRSSYRSIRWRASRMTHQHVLSKAVRQTLCKSWWSIKSHAQRTMVKLAEEGQALSPHIRFKLEASHSCSAGRWRFCRNSTRIHRGSLSASEFKCLVLTTIMRLDIGAHSQRLGRDEK